MNTLQIASGQEVNEELETNFQALNRNSNVHDLRGGNDALYRPVRAGSSMERSELQNRLAPILQTQIENLAHEVLPLVSSGSGSKRKRKLNRREIARRLAAVTLCLPPS